MRWCEYTLTCVLLPTSNGFRQARLASNTQVPSLRMGTDEQSHFSIRQQVQCLRSPGLGADPHGRAVAAISVISGKAEAHWQDGDPSGIIKILLRYLHPVTKPRSRRIIEGHARAISLVARCLARNQNTRTGMRVKDWVWGAIHLAFAQSACPNFFELCFQMERHGVSYSF